MRVPGIVGQLCRPGIVRRRKSEPGVTRPVALSRPNPPLSSTEPSPAPVVESTIQ